MAATTGILQLLDRDELEGVIAHELAHIKNRDTLTMTVAATVAGAISMLAQFGFLFGGGRDRDNPHGADRRAARGDLRADGGDADPDDDQPDAGVFRRPARRRDQRQPARRWPARCARSRPTPRRIAMPSAERNPTSAPLFIVNPLSGQRMDNLFSTHPNVENRIRALEAMAGGRPQRRSAAQRIATRPSPIPDRPAPVSASRPRGAPGGGGAARGRARSAGRSLGEQTEAADGPLARAGAGRAGAGAGAGRRRRCGISGGSTRVLGRLPADSRRRRRR